MADRARLLYIYASQDEPLRQALESHLTSLARAGLFAGRHVGLLLAGTPVSQGLAAEVAAASVVLLLLSADFMVSVPGELLEQVHKQRALRHLPVVPVLARPVDWCGLELADCQPLPRSGVPVTLWQNQDAAWVDVADGLRALLTGTAPGRASTEQEAIDFSVERIRHESFCGRQDVLAQLDQWLLGGRQRGYVLVTGSPGMGKSAILSQWLRRREQVGEPVPHHFLRRGQKDWDQPAAVTRSLAAQIERFFPAQCDPQALPERRLGDLLLRVSQDVLKPHKRRLIVVIDGLDEAAAPAGDNPLPRFLPWALPAGILFLCASRPTYPNLGWLKARDGGVPTVDLDDRKWSGSNAEACRRFWQEQEFTPPLPAALVAQALHRGSGNLLYAVKLRDQLEVLSAEERQVMMLPAGLAGWLDEIWHGFIADAASWPLLQRGLGLLCAAREALPTSVLDVLLGSVPLREALLRRVRSVLLEEPAAGHGSAAGAGEPAYRPYHHSFREFIEHKLGSAAMQAFHETLVQTLASWPAAPFHRSYALRHGLAQRAAAGWWAEVRALGLDAGYLEAKIGLVGLEATEGDLEQAARHCPETELQRELYDLARALHTESHWLRSSRRELAGLVYNRLVNSGWSEARLQPLRAAVGRMRLRHPLQRGDMSERTLVGHSGWVRACAVSADGRRVVSGASDKTVKVWDLDSGLELLTLAGHADGVRACAVSADGRRAVSEAADNTVRVWDLDGGLELFTLAGHADWVRACAVSADGRRAVSGADDKTVKVWDLDSGREMYTLLGHAGSVQACAVSADGRRAVSGASDTLLKVWDLDRGRELYTLSGHAAEVMACAVSMDGRRAVSGADDKTVKVWDLDRGRELCTLSGHADSVRACGMSADGRRAVSGSSDQTVKVWELGSGREQSAPSGHTDTVRACGMSLDGRRAVSGSSDRTLKVWDLDSGRELYTLYGHTDRVMGCAVNANGTRAISGSADRTLKVWDLDRGRELHTFSDQADNVRACAVSADGRRAVSGSADRTLKVWDLDSGQLLFTLCGHADWVMACAMSADGRCAVSGSDDKTLKVWDLEQGRELFTLAGHKNSVQACGLSADGRRAVSGSADKTLKVWDLERRCELLTLAGHTDSVRACAMSADGRRAVSGSSDKTLKLWDLDRGICLSTVHGMGTFGAVSLQGTRLVAGDAAGNVWMLELAET